MGTKIIGLRVNGIRKLTAVEMQFAEKGITAIVGSNGQGKTTLRDTIQFLLEGQRVSNKDFIQHGAERAEAEMTLGNWRIKRTLTHKSHMFEVKNIETGIKKNGRVQDFLDDMINELTFNPRPFTDSTPIQQLKFLLDLYNIDFTEIDKQLRTLEQDRLLTGREVDRFGEIVLPEKVDSIDVTELIAERKLITDANKTLTDQYEIDKQAELDEIEKYNKAQREKARAIEVETDNNNDLIKDLDHSAKEIARIKAELAALEADNEKILEMLNDSNEKLGKLPKAEAEKPLTPATIKPVLADTSELDQRISDAAAVNVKAEAYDKEVARRSEKAEKQKEYRLFDDKIKELREEKLETLRNIDTKVEGLEIKETGVYHNGTSSENWSGAEKTRIATELWFAMKPELEAVFIDDAEKLDAAATASLKEWAERIGVQVILTKVQDVNPDDLEDGVFYIEEGRVTTKNTLKLEDVVADEK